MQVDAVVTDRNGNLVTDLRPEDFEIRQDGRLQTIGTFGFVSASGDDGAPVVVDAPGAPPTATPPATAATAVAPSTPAAIAATGRTLVIVIDDLSLSVASVRVTKQALHKIVDTQIAANDRVSIVRTSGGATLSQQFTSDKTALHALVERLRFNPRQFERDDWQTVNEKQRLRDWPPLANSAAVGQPESPVDLTAKDSWSNDDNVRAERAFGAGAIGTLRYVVTALRPLPGRKGILYFSDGFSLRDEGRAIDPILEQALNRLVDQATRSRTVIYAINARPWEFMSGADVDLSPDALNPVSTGLDELNRTDTTRQTFFDTAIEGPAYLASQTGGFFFRNPSDLAKVVQKSLDDQRGYYLLGYVIDQQTADEDRRARTFHKLSVRVKRPGLSIRSRRGFLGGEDRDDPSARFTDASAAAGTTPLDVRLTGFFAGQQGDDSIVRALMYIDATSLELTRTDQERKAATFLEVSAALVDERGIVVRGERRTFRLQAAEQGTSGGMAYRLDVPVKAPGAYALRVAVREAVSNRSGGANQFVVVPDLKRKRLALSGVVLSASEGASADATGEAPATHPALRRFSLPAQLVYSFQVFNAHYGPGASPGPSLQTVVRLLRDGKPVYTAPAVPIRTDAKSGEPISVVGTLSLGSQTSPGDYALAVTVTDALAASAQSSATAVTDFTIAPPPSPAPR